MKRLFLLLGAGLVLSACASGQAAISSGPRQMHVSVKTVAAFRERHATRQATSLLLRIPLPAGRRPTSRVPHALRISNLGVSVLTQFAYVHRAWLVPRSPRAVERFVKANPVAGFANHTGALDSVGFDQEPAHGWPMQRMYEVSFAPSARHGWTVVKAEAAAAWVYPRSPEEVVPAHVRAIDIRGGGVSAHVGDGAKGAQIVRWFDALHAAPRGITVGCMAVLATRISFVFRSASGHALATADVPTEGSSSCNPMTFSVGGKRLAPLIDGRFGRYAFANRVQRLLGVCFPDPVRKCARARAASRRSTKAIAADRKHAATVSARRLLGDFVPPPGALRVAPGAHHLYVDSFGGPGAEFVDVPRFWVTRGSASSVASFERAHAPAGFSASGVSANRDRSRLQLRFVSPAHGASSRIIAVLIAQQRTRTVVRVDAQVVWVYPRSPLEVVPAQRVSEIDVKAPHVSRHISDPAKVSGLVRLFNGLPVSPPGVASLCAPFTYVRVELVFRSAGGSRVASANVPAVRAGTCDPIDFTLGGKQQPALVDHPRGPSFAVRLQRLLGVKLR